MRESSGSTGPGSSPIPRPRSATAAAARFDEAVVRRESGEPVAYIRGVREFLGLAFVVDERGLIPRPETERLVELAEVEIARRLTGAPRPPGSPPIRVIDVGTGSGAIAVSLAVRLRRRRMADDVDILAVDDLDETLDLARENAVGHAVGDLVRFATADLVPAIETPFDLILANLPYVATSALEGLAVGISFEPRHALDGGPDGLSMIGRLVAMLPDVLARRRRRAARDRVGPGSRGHGARPRAAGRLVLCRRARPRRPAARRPDRALAWRDRRLPRAVRCHAARSCRAPSSRSCRSG